MVGLELLGSVLDSVAGRTCSPWEWLECELLAAPRVGRLEEMCAGHRLHCGCGRWLEAALLMPCIPPCLT